jgi:pyrroline-5-carboxylate reductase
VSAPSADPAAGATGGVLLVGCGKMGGALLQGWLESGVAPSFAVVEPGPGAAAFAGRREVRLYQSAVTLDLDLRPSVIVFAVKPQAMGDVVHHYRRFVTPETVFLSIAAGKTLAYFTRHLGAEAAIIRAMPNTPAAIGRGISVGCPNPLVSAIQIALCDRLLAAAGEVAWVDDEALIDAVTAVSGSGPAYVFLLIESLAKAGVAVGLPAELAMRLARATVSGAGELAHLSKEPAEVLRQNVTSPGGTTRAALDVLMTPDGLEALMTKAVAAAAARSRELAE